MSDAAGTPGIGPGKQAQALDDPDLTQPGPGSRRDVCAGSDSPCLLMRRVFLMLVLAGVVAVLVAPAALAGQSGQGAQKAPLFEGQWLVNSNCADGASDTGATFGFVVMNVDGDGRFILTVSVKRAAPDTRYSVWSTSADDALLGICSGTPLLGYLTTNGQGNGQFHFKLDGVGEAHNVWIILEGGSPFRRFQSPAVSLG